MKKILLKPLLAAAIIAFATACGTSGPVITSTPIENIDTQVLKTTPLNEEQLKDWWHQDLAQDTIPGMSIHKAYQEIIKNQEGKTVIVGVIDSGVDVEHEDLKNVLWVNEGEIPGNGIDDDKNGYIDDIHGWNFLGNTIEENMEYVRIIRDFEKKFEGKTESQIAAADKKAFQTYQRALKEFEKEYTETEQNIGFYKSLADKINSSNKLMLEKTGKKELTKENLAAYEPQGAEELEAKSFLLNMINNLGSIEDASERLTEATAYFQSRLDTHFNKNLYGRKTNDNIHDINDKYYGNGDVDGPDPKKEDAKHGTHVAGIIAAQRNNNIGMDGVANNVKIMAVRAVPDGDEYDKDIALAIRYAVDNGAKVLNTSFGKYFSTNPEWVIDAIKYAEKHDVLIVNAAGNDATNLDEKQVYPNDQTPENPVEISNNVLTVGASNFDYGTDLIATFSNYGKENVDVFAPGTKIYATTPLNTYEFLQGTSMASPAVAGIAAMIRSYFPKLTAKQVKEVIMESGLWLDTQVIVPGQEDVKAFSELSKSGRLANLYNAFILASKK